MKKISCFLAVLLLSVGYCIATPQVVKGKYFIKGLLQNIPDGTVLELYRLDNRMYSRLAIDTLKNGSFSFVDTISAVQKLYISCPDKGFPLEMLSLWVAPAKQISIVGNDKLISTWKVTSDIIEQKYENDFLQVSFKERQELSKLGILETALMRKMFNNKGEMQLDDKTSQQVRDSIRVLRKLESPFLESMKQKELKYMKQAPVSIVWMKHMAEYASMITLKEYKPYEFTIRSLYQRIPKTMKQSPEGKEITAYLYPKKTVGVGDMMTDGVLYDKNGIKHRLSEFKGRYILLDFWSQACGPCIASLPEMKKMEEVYKDKLVVISISEDPKDIWIKFINKKGLQGNQWNELRSSRTGLWAIYGVTGIPHYVLINTNGKIIDVWDGYSKGYIEEKLKKHL